MCIKAIRKIFGIPDPGDERRRREAYERELEAANQTAADGEGARQSAESRLRKLLSGKGVGSFLQVPQLSQAQVGVRTLLGA